MRPRPGPGLLYLIQVVHISRGERHRPPLAIRGGEGEPQLVGAGGAVQRPPAEQPGGWLLFHLDLLRALALPLRVGQPTLRPNHHLGGHPPRGLDALKLEEPPRRRHAVHGPPELVARPLADAAVVQRHPDLPAPSRRTECEDRLERGGSRRPLLRRPPPGRVQGRAPGARHGAEQLLVPHGAKGRRRTPEPRQLLVPAPPQPAALPHQQVAKVREAGPCHGRVPIQDARRVGAARLAHPGEHGVALAVGAPLHVRLL